MERISFDFSFTKYAEIGISPKLVFFRSSVARVVERAVARRLEAEDGWRDALVELGPRKAEPAEPGRRSQKFN